MFYYKDNNNFLVKSSKEIKTEALTPLTETEYLELIAARASKEAEAAATQIVENISE